MIETDSETEARARVVGSCPVDEATEHRLRALCEAAAASLDIDALLAEYAGDIRRYEELSRRG